jgi:hypothetical protein
VVVAAVRAAEVAVAEEEVVAVAVLAEARI